MAYHLLASNSGRSYKLIQSFANCQLAGVEIQPINHYQGAKMVKGGTYSGGLGVYMLSRLTPWLFRILAMISNNSIKYL